MEKILNSIFIHRWLLLILFLAFVIRVLFVLWGAAYYFDRANVFVDGDTAAWRIGFENFIESGTYTNNAANERGYFGRLPGYAFFMGAFYFLAGMNWALAYPLIGWFQVILDVFSVLLVFNIASSFFNKKVGYIAGILYATYPFIIVWNPVVYSESLSVFVMLLSLWFIVKKNNSWKNIMISGLLLGFGILLRPQVLILGLPLLVLMFIKAETLKVALKMVFFLGLGVSITYLHWPIRNYLKTGEVVLTQDIRGLGHNWDVDVTAFLQYIYSVKAEWNPQFSTIIQNKETVWPGNAYTSTEDSLLLEKAVFLSKTCGYGFSRWKGNWKEPVSKEESCSNEIAEIFNYLRVKQIQAHPWNFYVVIPLKNLKKAIFKTDLYYTPATSFASHLSKFLFAYRTLLILLGLFASIALVWQKNYSGLFFILYFLLLYLILAAGTSPQMRNIEIRYFLHADILLLIPAAWGLYLILSHFKITTKSNYWSNTIKRGD